MDGSNSSIYIIRPSNDKQQLNFEVEQNNDDVDSNINFTKKLHSRKKVHAEKEQVRFQATSASCQHSINTMFYHQRKPLRLHVLQPRHSCPGKNLKSKEKITNKIP